MNNGSFPDVSRPRPTPSHNGSFPDWVSANYFHDNNTEKRSKCPGQMPGNLQCNGCHGVTADAQNMATAVRVACDREHRMMMMRLDLEAILSDEVYCQR